LGRLLEVVDIGCHLLYGGEKCVLGYATYVDVALHKYVATHTPRCSPRIADYPVIGGVGPAVTHNENAMIDSSILAGVVVKNA
jgi:hypothetical protein